MLGKAPSDLAERKRTLPVVLGLEADLRVAEQLAKPVDDAGATAQLRVLLDVLDIRGQAEELTRSAAEKALGALHALGLSPSWERALADTVNFVADRCV